MIVKMNKPHRHSFLTDDTDLHGLVKMRVKVKMDYHIDIVFSQISFLTDDTDLHGLVKMKVKVKMDYHT